MNHPVVAHLAVVFSLQCKFLGVLRPVNRHRRRPQPRFVGITLVLFPQVSLPPVPPPGSAALPASSPLACLAPRCPLGSFLFSAHSAPPRSFESPLRIVSVRLFP